MPTYRVTSRYLGSIEVEANNWLSALGEGLYQFGIVGTVERVVAEVMRDRVVLARDLKTRHGYVVRQLDELSDEMPEESLVDDVALTVEPRADELEPLSVADEIDEILAAPTIRQAAEHVVDALSVLVPTEAGSVLIRRADATLAFIAATGPGADQLMNVSLPPGTGIAGFVVQRGVPVILTDAYSDPRTFRAVDEITGLKTNSILSVPISHGRRVLGCVELINCTAPNGFDQDALADAEIFARALGRRMAEGQQDPRKKG